MLIFIPQIMIPTQGNNTSLQADLVYGMMWHSISHRRYIPNFI
ncbi:hypothetical protein R9208_08775 [Flammeovirgaceae bacterium SG7u.132]|nr:hypothetical protein [Flammeovirgaceae bacterium SG7u.132]